MDAALEEIADKQKAGIGSPSPPPEAGTPLGRTATRKKRTARKTKVDDHNLVVFKRKVERKMRGEIVRNNPPSSSIHWVKRFPILPAIGGGSKVKVIYQPYAYDTAVKGVQFQLVGLQIVELKAAASEISVAPVEGGWQAEREGIDELQAILND